MKKKALKFKKIVREFDPSNFVQKKPRGKQDAYLAVYENCWCGLFGLDKTTDRSKESVTDYAWTKEVKEQFKNWKWHKKCKDFFDHWEWILNCKPVDIES